MRPSNRSCTSTRRVHSCGAPRAPARWPLVEQRRHLGHRVGLPAEVELGAQALGELGEHLAGAHALPNGVRRWARLASSASAARSRSIITSMSGRCTLTTTGSPVCSRAR